jgi:hypothetical protein
MPRKTTILFVLSLLVLSAGAIVATGQERQPADTAGTQGAMGTAFTYQGRLVDAGSPADGDYDLQFALFDGPEGGSPLDTIEIQDHAVAQGRFTVLLDFGPAAFDGTARWLAIGVRPWDSGDPYTPLTPRQALTPAPYALALPGLWTQQHEFSPNLVGGYSQNWVADGIWGATIGGGGEDWARNRVTDKLGTVGGGTDNQAGDDAGSIEDAELATVGGGASNTAGGAYSTVGGGIYNSAAYTGTTVGGGWGNVASGETATVGGGGGNQALGLGSTVAGGGDNLASGEYNATVGGGYGNAASETDATVSGGNTNTAGAWAATVGGGMNNTTGGPASTIGGGVANTIAAESYMATVSGGFSNTVTAFGATASGGLTNTVSGVGAAVPGGAYNTAAGDYSLALGYGAQANHEGSFVWADSRNEDLFESNRDYQFSVQAWGGAQFEDGDGNWLEFLWGDPINTSTGAYLSHGGTWTNSSDAARKENFAAVDSRQILEALAVLPNGTWNYRAEGDNVVHLGPTAQDFYAAFGLGDSETAISTIDADGVALASIQALYELLQERDAQIAALEARLTALEAATESQGSLTCEKP